MHSPPKKKALVDTPPTVQHKSKPSISLVDSRPEALLQRKIQGVANDSLQVKSALQFQQIANQHQQIPSTHAPIQFKNDTATIQLATFDDFEPHQQESLERLGFEKGLFSNIPDDATQRNHIYNQLIILSMPPYNFRSEQIVKHMQEIASGSFEDKITHISRLRIDKKEDHSGEKSSNLDIRVMNLKKHHDTLYDQFF